MTRGNVRYRFSGNGYTLHLVRWLTDETALARFNEREDGAKRFKLDAEANAQVKQCTNVTLERETFNHNGRTTERTELARRELD